jgi:hypothetical protein
VNVPIRHFTGQPNTAEGCTAGEDTAPPDLQPFPAGFFNGAVALIRRGNCPFTKKIQNAFNAGAIFVIIRNNVATDAPVLNMTTTGQPNIPAYGIGGAQGDALVAFVDANPSSATINFDRVPSPADILADFSLRGPIAGAFQDLTKPDITAPGVNILAAYPFNQTGYGTISGTSMSSPHSAGAAALIKSVHPGWTAPEIKSALMMTSLKDGKKENRVTPWNPDDVGNGRVELTRAARAGLVMHETTVRFLNANPASGGDPKVLNIPSMRNVACAPHCQWTRTVRNTKTTPSSWTATGVPSVPGFNITVEPSTFAFGGGLTETQQLTITARPTTALTSAVTFGEVRLTEASGQSPEQHMTVAIKGEPFVVGAVSRKVHGTTSYDIPLPLLGTTAVEPRVGPADGTHQIVVTFTGPVTLTGASVVQGTGAATFAIAGNDVIVNIANAPDVQRLVVRLAGVSNGTTTANVDIPVRLLAGDVNNSGGVTASDIGAGKNGDSPGTVSSTNFRADVNANGTINATDVSLVKSKSGNAVP